MAKLARAFEEYLASNGLNGGPCNLSCFSAWFGKYADNATGTMLVEAALA